LQFLVIKTLDPDWIRIGIQQKMLDPDPYQMNTDPKHRWYLLYLVCAATLPVLCGEGLFDAGIHGARRHGGLAHCHVHNYQSDPKVKA
jgi:hypothetical protein